MPNNLRHIMDAMRQAEIPRYVAPAEAQLSDAIVQAGFERPSKPIDINGKIQRFKTGTKGAPGHDESGWYVAFPDGVPAGMFGCWRTGETFKWQADVGRDVTPAERMANVRRMEEARSIRAQEEQKKNADAASQVDSIWAQSAPASPDHPYIAKKGIKVNGARVHGDGRLIVPLFSEDGEILSLQYISHDGQKLYHPGGKTKGSHWIIGNIKDTGEVFMAEGFATAATIHEATGRPVVVAYSASNLVPVAASLRNRLGPGQLITIVADNDKSGVGEKYAEQASAKYGARVVLVPDEGSDANDYVASGGDLLALLTQSPQNIIEKMDVVFGDQLGEEFEPPDEIVEGLLTSKSSAILYGDSNSGKTFLALALAYSVATGSEFFGRKVDKGPVVYLASEAPGSVKVRAKALKKKYGAALENLVIVQAPVNFHENESSTNDVIQLVHDVSQKMGTRVKMIIGDTFARMSAGANENSGEDMGPIIGRFERICKETGANVTFIHHSGKDATKGARGWSGIRAAVDTEIEITESKGSRKAVVTKQRELPSKGQEIPFKLEVIEMGVTKFGATATTCVAIPDDAEDIQEFKKKESAIETHRKTFENAWWASDSELRNARPYLSRAGMVNYMVEKMGLTEASAKAYIKPMKSGKVISDLLTAGIIEAFEHGWVVIDEAHRASMMFRKQHQ